MVLDVHGARAGTHRATFTGSYPLMCFNAGKVQANLCTETEVAAHR
jgi:hypothetical protein